MSTPADLVFLLDVDNTLLDNDRFAADLTQWLEQAFGAPERERYWNLYNALRDSLGYADYLGSAQQFRVGLDGHPQLLNLSSFLLDYAFEQRLYPDALATLAHLHTLGRPVILSDGDVVFQPRKIQRAGLRAAVDDHVLIFLHKERVLDVVQQHYPATHYVMVDDKPHILAAMKQQLGERLTTVFVRQGHYAAAAVNETIEPLPDRVIDHIGELHGRSLSFFLTAAQVAATDAFIA